MFLQMLEKSLLILNVCFLCFGIIAYVQGITTKEKPVEANEYTLIIEEVLNDVEKVWDSELGDEYFREMYTKAVEDAIEQHTIDPKQRMFFANLHRLIV